jgi:hypothetical protein
MRQIISANTQRIPDANIVKGPIIVVKEQVLCVRLAIAVEPGSDFEHLDWRVLSLASERQAGLYSQLSRARRAAVKERSLL